jgi:uncharacterized protein
MDGLFVDTWGWLALRDKADPRHRQAVAAFNGAVSTKHPIVTSDYVLDETFTLLFRRLAIHKAKESLESLMAITDAGAVSLVPISRDRFREAVRLRVKYKDKPEISFTDFTSMVVMRESRAKRILTEDRHFAQVGMGFELVP